MPYSDTEICNLALAELPDKPIASLDENSLQARECKRVYQQAIDELFELHPWSFGTKRLALAQIANDRVGEWSYAYAVPSGISMIRKVVSVPSSGVGSFVPLVGQVMAPARPTLTDRAPATPFVLAGSTIYSDVPGAVVEFIPPGAEATFSALFVKALYFDIASRICVPLTKAAEKKRELIGQAELWKGRAMAADLNRQPNAYDPSPADLAAYS